MTKPLYVTASPRSGDSASIAAADWFVTALRNRRPDVTLDRLDLWDEPLPEFTDDALAAKYALLSGQALDRDQARKWARVEQIVARFRAADALVIATPMWNFGIPYKLKHWIDLITQPGLTFTFDRDHGYAPVLPPRPTLVVLASSGDYRVGPSYGRPDLATPYLEAALAFLGLGPVAVERVGPTAGPPDQVQSARTEALSRLDDRLAGFLAVDA